MSPQIKRLNNESGIVLFIVLMTAIIIMIFSVGILTQSQNEINYAQQQIDQIAADQLARGLFWSTYAAGGSQGASSSTSLQSGRNYQLVIGPTTNNAPFKSYTVTASYDTFQ